MHFFKNLVFPAGYGLDVNSYIQKPPEFVDYRETVLDLVLHWLLLNLRPPRQAFTGGTEKSA